MADRAAVLAKIREHYAALDIPLDKLSDIDVEMGVRQLAAAARDMGTSTEAINSAMRQAVEAIEKAAAEREAKEEAERAAQEEAEGGAKDGPAPAK